MDAIAGAKAGVGVASGEHHAEVGRVDRRRLDAHDDLFVGRPGNLGLMDPHGDDAVVGECRSQFECGSGNVSRHPTTQPHR